MTVNKVTLVGRLGADPEMRTANSGTVIANLRMATDGRVKRGNDWETVTEWHRVTVFGRAAENVERFCAKGKQLYIEGRLQTRKWQDKDGNDRWTTEIIANDVKFLGDGGSGDQSSQSQKSTKTSATPKRSTTQQDDDIPF